MLVSRMPIARKLSSWARSFKIQDEGSNSSLVSAGLQMAEQKNSIRKHIASPQLLSGFSVSPGSATAMCVWGGLHLQRAAQHPPVPRSEAFCTGGTHCSHCFTSRWGPPLASVSHLQQFSPLYFSHRIWLLNLRRFESSTCSGVTAQNFSSASDQAHGKAAYVVAYMWWWVSHIMKVLMKLLNLKVPFLLVRNIYVFKIKC